MAILQCSQNVSVAHRPKSGVELGNNLTVHLAVAAHGDFSFERLLERVKQRLDHRCLFEDEPRFVQSPSTLEAITTFLAEDLFQQPLQQAKWVSVEVAEQDRVRCRVLAGEREIRVELRHRNLTLELKGTPDPTTLELGSREEIFTHVDRVFAEISPMNGESESAWGERLFMALRKGVPALQEVTVDLGRHRSMRLAEVR